MSVEEMEADLLNETSGIDIAMIKGCKNLVVEFLLRYRDLEMNGLSIEDLFMINYPNMA